METAVTEAAVLGVMSATTGHRLETIAITVAMALGMRDCFDGGPDSATVHIANVRTVLRSLRDRGEVYSRGAGWAATWLLITAEEREAQLRRIEAEKARDAKVAALLRWVGFDTETQDSILQHGHMTVDELELVADAVTRLREGRVPPWPHTLH